MGDGSQAPIPHTQGAYWPDCTCVMCYEGARRGGTGSDSSAGAGILDALHIGSSADEIKALREVLAHLVKERGGVVHIWGTDLLAAPTERLVVEKRLDPWALVIKVVNE